MCAYAVLRSLVKLLQVVKIRCITKEDILKWRFRFCTIAQCERQFLRIMEISGNVAFRK